MCDNVVCVLDDIVCVCESAVCERVVGDNVVCVRKELCVCVTKLSVKELCESAVCVQELSVTMLCVKERVKCDKVGVKELSFKP